MATKSKEEILEEELERLLRVGAVRRVPKLQLNGLSPSNEGTHHDKERETFKSDVIIGRSGKQYSRKKSTILFMGITHKSFLKYRPIGKPCMTLRTISTMSHVAEKSLWKIKMVIPFRGKKSGAVWQSCGMIQS